MIKKKACLPLLLEHVPGAHSACHGGLVRANLADGGNAQPEVFLRFQLTLNQVVKVGVPGLEDRGQGGVETRSVADLEAVEEDVVEAVGSDVGQAVFQSQARIEIWTHDPDPVDEMFTVRSLKTIVENCFSKITTSLA